MLPKHTQAQNKILATHVRTAMLSCVSPVTNVYSFPVVFKMVKLGGASVELGTIPGLRPRNTLMPVRPTSEESRKPVRVRSRRYQRTGFARASVSDACVVDSQGVRR